MDSVTHITLGACLGELVLGKKLGKPALLWGAITQSLPDIDSIATLFLSPDRALLIHRGITHSVIFALLVGLVLTLLARRVHRNIYLSLATLVLFFCGQLLLHDLLDTCNAYGTGLLEPFSHQRFSINLLYVIDPLFTIGLFVAFVVLIFKSIRYQNRAKWAFTAILISMAYLCFAGFSKLYTSSRVLTSLKKQGKQANGDLITPAPFTSILWYVIVPADQGYYTGYSSIFDDSNKTLVYNFHPQNDSLLQHVQNKQLLNNLLSFSAQYYTVSKTPNNININVLRFGQIQGWAFADAPFAFSYPLLVGTNQALILQKGRMSGWSSHSFKIYIGRILGNQTIYNKPNHKKI